VCTLERDAAAKKDNDSSFIIIKANEEEEENNSFFFFSSWSSLKNQRPLSMPSALRVALLEKLISIKKLIQKLAIFFHLS